MNKINYTVKVISIFFCSLFVHRKSRLALYSKSAKEEQQIFWQKNAKLNRPVSPHLTIYKLPLTANMSICHRATGNALSGGMLFLKIISFLDIFLINSFFINFQVVILFGLGSFYFSGNFEKDYQYLQENVHPHVMLTLKTLLALPLTYHTLAGIRHLYWDTGRGLQLPTLYKSGYALIALAILSALAIASM